MSNADSNAELVSSILDGTPTGDDRARLREGLRQDTELRDQWIAQVAMDDLLKKNSRNQNQHALRDKLLALADVESAGRKRRRRIIYAVIGVGGGTAALLLLVILPLLFLPAVQASREAARRTSSINNLKQISLGFLNFYEEHNSLPAAYSTDPRGRPLLSWRVYILPYIDQQELFEKFHLDEPWDSEHNLSLLDEMPITYRSPLEAKESDTESVYLAIPTELGIIFPPDETQFGKSPPLGIPFQQVTDGTSNTAMVVEVDSSLAVPWTSPQDYPVTADAADSTKPAARRAKKEWMSAQRIECERAVFADGAVQETPVGVTLAVVTRAGGEKTEDSYSN